MINIEIGDCLNILKQYPDNCIDLIITSPPYADARKKSYGGISPDKYVEWFLPRSEQFFRILKPTGTFILNIKEKVVKCERHTYVLELILALKKQGWLWTEEYIWHKKSCYPGKWRNRFRDAWERCLQFNKNKKFQMFQENVMIPMSKSTVNRLKNLQGNDKIRLKSATGSNFGKNISNWIGRTKAYPTNVLHFAATCRNKKHSATFPNNLPEWFIKLFTKKGDMVLDPFAGSGTTCLVAEELKRNSIGIEIKPEYYDIIMDSINGQKEKINKQNS